MRLALRATEDRTLTEIHAEWEKGPILGEPTRILSVQRLWVEIEDFRPVS